MAERSTVKAAAPERVRAPLSTGMATLMVAVSACCFGAIAIFTLFATRAGANLPTILVTRYALAAPVLLWLAGGPRRIRLPRHRLLPLLLVGGIGQSAVTWTGLSALLFIPAGAASFLFYTYPAWIMLGSIARGVERLRWNRLVALALALAGVAFVVGSPSATDLNPIGIAYALGAAIIYSIYVPLIDRVQSGMPPAVAATWVVISAGSIYLVAGAATGAITAPARPMQFALAVSGMALVSTVLGFMLFLRGLAAIGPVRTSIISTIEPFFTAILAAWLLDQRLAALTFVGGGLVAAAVVLLQLGGGGGEGRQQPVRGRTQEIASS